VRASECYRSAYFFCRRDPHGAQLLNAFRLSRDMFRRALPHLPVAAEVVEIPYEDGVTIPPLAGKGATGFGIRLLDRLVADHYES
jgi:hypothetical protein